MSVVITEGNETILEGGFGYNQDEKMDVHTPTYIASVTKSMTATGIMLLSERGLLDINAPITMYIPDFRLADHREDEITVLHLMSHTSGLSSSQFEYDEKK